MKNDILFEILLESLKDSFVFVDPDHIIRYMNSAAKSHYEEGASLIGQSIFSCHNEESKRITLEIFEKFNNGLDEEKITDKDNLKIYMRAVRDKNGTLMGYYERYESITDLK